MDALTSEQHRGLSLKDNPSLLMEKNSNIIDIIDTPNGQRAVLETGRGFQLVGYIDDIAYRSEGEVVRVDLPKTVERLAEQIQEKAEPPLDLGNEKEKALMWEAKTVKVQTDKIHQIDASEYPNILERKHIAAELPKYTHVLLEKGKEALTEERHAQLRKEMAEVKEKIKNSAFCGDSQIQAISAFVEDIVGAGEPQKEAVLNFLQKVLTQEYGPFGGGRILGSAEYTLGFLYGDFYKPPSHRKEEMKKLAMEAVAHYFGVGENCLHLSGDAIEFGIPAEQESGLRKRLTEEGRFLCLDKDQTQVLGIPGDMHLLSNRTILATTRA